MWVDAIYKGKQSSFACLNQFHNHTPVYNSLNSNLTLSQHLYSNPHLAYKLTQHSDNILNPKPHTIIIPQLSAHHINPESYHPLKQMDSSASNFDKTYLFDQPSNSHILNQSSFSLGLNASHRQNPLSSQEQVSEEELTLDWELLQKQPLFLKQTAKLLQNRANDPLLSKLCTQFIELSQKMHARHSAEQQERKQDNWSERADKIQKHKQLLQEFKKITKDTESIVEQRVLLHKQNRLIIGIINSLKSFVKEMAMDHESNPFASIDNSNYIESLMIVSEINEEFGRKQQQRYVDDKDIELQLQINNSILIEERTSWLETAQQLQNELKNLIQQEEIMLGQVKHSIINSKNSRNIESQHLVIEQSEIIDPENNQINLKTNIIPQLIEKTINKIYTSDKDCQRFTRTLQSYFDQIHQLKTKKNALESQLKYSQSIVNQKNTKKALIQKQHQQFQSQLKKLQIYNHSQASIDIEQVNYEGLVFKTYELKEHNKNNQNIIPQLDNPKPAKRILVEKQNLSFTKKHLPFIKNYKQLINWIFALWVLVILLIFSCKALVKNGVQTSSETVVELELPERPVIHTIKTKLTSTELITNESHTIDMIPKAQVYQKEDLAVLELRRKQMEQLNDGQIVEEKSDWRKNIIEEFQ